MWIRNRGKGLFPFQTKRVPAELNMLLPVLTFAARDGDEATLAAELVESSSLLKGDAKAHTLGLSGTVAALFCFEALGGLPVSQQSRDRLFPIAVEVAQHLPMHLDATMLRRWIDQATGGTRTVKYARAADFDVSGLGYLVAIEGAAARSRHWTDEEILELFRLARNAYEHTTYRFK